MKSFAAYRRDALRYRALESTEEASPWANVLGGHKRLATLADALVSIIKKDHGVELEEKDYKALLQRQKERRDPDGIEVHEDAPTMGVSAAAGLGTDPPVSKLAQRKWIKKNAMARRNKC